MRKGRKIRVLIGKLGLDGHERGAAVVSQALRDAGMEVIYVGIRRTPEELVATAIQEDVDVIGISILSGGHLTSVPLVLEQLRKEAVDIIVIAGGIIPDEDIPILKQAGVKEIFGPGTPTQEIAHCVQNLVWSTGKEGGSAC